jgi:hypothetical protein
MASFSKAYGEDRAAARERAISESRERDDLHRKMDAIHSRQDGLERSMLAAVSQLPRDIREALQPVVDTAVAQMSKAVAEVRGAA